MAAGSAVGAAGGAGGAAEGRRAARRAAPRAAQPAARWEARRAAAARWPGPRRGLGRAAAARHRAGPVLHRPRAQQREEAALDVLLGQRDDLEDLARGQHAVDAREQEAVGGAQGQLLHRHPRVGRHDQRAVHVTQHLGHDLGRLQPARGLEDDLAGEDLRLDVGGALHGHVLEGEDALAAVDHVEQDVADVEADALVEAGRGEDALLPQQHAEALALAEHDGYQHLEGGLVDEAVAHEHVPEVLALDVGRAVEDVSAHEEQAPPLRAVGEMEVAGLPRREHVAHELEQRGRVGGRRAALDFGPRGGDGRRRLHHRGRRPAAHGGGEGGDLLLGQRVQQVDRVLGGGHVRGRERRDPGARGVATRASAGSPFRTSRSAAENSPALEYRWSTSRARARPTIGRSEVELRPRRQLRGRRARA